MKEADIENLKQLLAVPSKIVIVPHRNPDGDAMGSTLALYGILKKCNHDVLVISPNEFPDFLSWLPTTDNVLIYEKNKELASKHLQDASIVFTLDFNALHRTGEMELVLSTLNTTFVMIDHHEKPDAYAEYTYSDTTIGSTCEMIYNFAEFMDFKKLLDKDIATCIYTGILTDSGGFRYPRTTGRTHRIAAELIDLGVENTNIPSLLYENNSFSRLQLMGRAFANMTIVPNKKTTYTCLSQKELDEFKFVKGDTEGFVNYGLSIKGIIFAVIFIENKQENIVKISFRSKDGFDVNAFAREHFEGGGHVSAAGGKSNLSLKETIVKFEKLLETIEI